MAPVRDHRGPPPETATLRRELRTFLDRQVSDPYRGTTRVGSYKWGVYAFFDYDEEPIYVGQTYESLRSRIGRHLTNQRTDAVAMNVLDPFEVRFIRVWPLPQFQECTREDTEARRHLDALEHQVFEMLLRQSRFGAVLNEKPPQGGSFEVDIPEAYEGEIVPPAVLPWREHPDVRIARRALTLSKLAQVISERQVDQGLRQTLLTQGIRLCWLAEARLRELREGDQPSGQLTGPWFGSSED